MKNQVQLIGNLGNSPEVKNFDNAKKLAKFQLATNESYRNEKGEKIEDTQWHPCIAWGKTAEIFEKYTEKGSQVAIQGKLTHRSYEDRDGYKRFITEVVVSEVLLLSK